MDVEKTLAVGARAFSDLDHAPETVQPFGNHSSSENVASAARPIITRWAILNAVGKRVSDMMPPTNAARATSGPPARPPRAMNAADVSCH